MERHFIHATLRGRCGKSDACTRGHSLRRKCLPARNANRPSDGHKLRNDRSVAVHFQVASTQKPAGICVPSLGRVSGEAVSSMRRLGGYPANGRKRRCGRLSRVVRSAGGLQIERLRPMPSAKSGCPMRLTESSAEACPCISFPAAGREPDRRTAGTESGAAPFAAFSNRSFFWSAVSAGNGCPTRYDAPYGNYAWKPPWRSFPAVSRYPDRRTLGTEPGPAPFAATSPTVGSFGVLFLRKADARCAIRNQARKPVPASPSRRLANAPTSGLREQNSVQRLSRRSRIACPIGSRNSKSCASAGHAQD